MWLSLAEAQGSKTAAEAKKSLGSIMTKQQVSAAESRVSEWQLRHQPKMEKVDGGQEKAGAGQ
jgi:hypothetical protein